MTTLNACFNSNYKLFMALVSGEITRSMQFKRGIDKAITTLAFKDFVYKGRRPFPNIDGLMVASVIPNPKL